MITVASSTMEGDLIGGSTEFRMAIVVARTRDMQSIFLSNLDYDYDSRQKIEWVSPLPSWRTIHSAGSWQAVISRRSSFLSNAKSNCISLFRRNHSEKQTHPAIRIE